MAKLDEICSTCQNLDSRSSGTLLSPGLICSASLIEENGRKILLVIDNPRNACINNGNFQSIKIFKPKFSYDDIPKIETEMHLDNLSDYINEKLRLGSSASAGRQARSIVEDLIRVFTFGKDYRGPEFVKVGPPDPYSWVLSHRINMGHIGEFIVEGRSPKEIEDALLKNVQMFPGPVDKSERKEMANFMTGLFLAIVKKMKGDPTRRFS